MDYIDIAMILVGCGVACGFIGYFFKLSKEKQIENIKEWLLYACLEAEKMLGSKTGKVKLRFVYDMFISKYGFLSKLISFEMFSALVDEALEQMRHMIENNEAVANYVNK